MTQIDKLINKILQEPTVKDFTWKELEKLLRSLGYEKRERSGSRVSFIIPGNRDSIIQIHKPHPNRVVKPKALESVKETLVNQDLI